VDQTSPNFFHHTWEGALVITPFSACRYIYPFLRYLRSKCEFAQNRTKFWTVFALPNSKGAVPPKIVPTLSCLPRRELGDLGPKWCVKVSGRSPEPSRRYSAAKCHKKPQQNISPPGTTVPGGLKRKKPQQNISPPGTTVPGGLIKKQTVMRWIRDLGQKNLNGRK